MAIDHKVAGRKAKANRQAAGHKEIDDHRETGLHVRKVAGHKVIGHLARKAAGHRETGGRNKEQVAGRKAIGHHARKAAGLRETGPNKTGEASLIKTGRSSKVINRSKVLIISKIGSLSQRRGRRKVEQAGHKETGRLGTATTGRGATVRRVTGLQDLKGTSPLVSQVRHLHRRDYYYYGHLTAKSV